MEASEITPIEASAPDPVQSAMEALVGAQVAVDITTGGGPGAVLPEVKFPRLSFARRVLGHVTDEVDETAYGPRNTLAALTRGLTMDRHTTNPSNPDAERFDITHSTLEQQIQGVLDQLIALGEAGLVSQHADGSYHVTEAGHTELGS